MLCLTYGRRSEHPLKNDLLPSGDNFGALVRLTKGRLVALVFDTS